MRETDIAIIGLSCRLPGAGDHREFWKMLCDGVDARVEYSAAQLRKAGVPESVIGDPNYVPCGRPLAAIDHFDARFFGLSPLEARVMDPQHRQFLECCWEAFEDAAVIPSRFDGAIGVFAGSGMNAYFPYNVLRNAEVMKNVGFFLARHTGNDKDFLSTRVSYCLNLTGPSINIQTACSTSLVAVHAAAQSLLAAECDMALAGGVTIELPHEQGYVYREGEILSPDGVCRPFDADSSGTVFGSGVGVVLLKRAVEALEDNDPVYALIRGSAINNDGASKVGYLAPSVEGQARAAAECIEVSEIAPDSITYVETHGTGTPIGDPIEVAALTQAFGEGGNRKQYCAIGSVKSNIGHLDTAAGVAGLIKTSLALRHRKLPPSINFREPNPSIEFSDTPFFVNSSLTDWAVENGPRRAGVNSLGVGGTNAHVILEEWPGSDKGHPETAPSGPFLLAYSARSGGGRKKMATRLASYLRSETPDLLDVSYTLLCRRTEWEYRRAHVCHSLEDAVEVLAHPRPENSAEGRAEDVLDVTFMFAGGGAQFPGMGEDLYDSNPVYHSVIDDGLRILVEEHGVDLRDTLFPPSEHSSEAALALERPSRALPLLFLTQYAQARLWESWGVTAAAYVGHSMGEYTAACLAGVFDLSTALAVVLLRGRLFERTEPGAMLSVARGTSEVSPMLPEGCSIAAANAPELCVVSGPEAMVEKVQSDFEERDIDCSRVRISVAAHSALLDTILDKFDEGLREFRFHAPRRPFISNVTGDWIEPSQATDPGYWVKHLRSTVLFGEGVQKASERSATLMLEVGPGRTLANLARLNLPEANRQRVVTSMRHPSENVPDDVFMLGALGRAWALGANVAFTEYFDGKNSRAVSVPASPWEHLGYWIEPDGTGFLNESTARPPVEEWLHSPTWVPHLVGTDQDPGRAPLLIVGPDTAVAAIQEGFRALTDRPITTCTGAEFAATLESESENEEVDIVLALETSHPLAGDKKVIGPLFSMLLGVVRVCGRRQSGVRLVIMTNGVHRGNAPLGAIAAGACNVAPLEYENLRCSWLDIDPEENPDCVASSLRDVLRKENGPRVFRLTEGTLCERRFSQLTISRDERTPFAAGGTYVFTGGLGDLSLSIARSVASETSVNLVLLARTPIAAETTANSGYLNRDTVRRLEVTALGDSGSTVTVGVADVTDPVKLGAVLKEIVTQFGRINGVFHTAGVLKDSLIELKPDEDAKAVLEPKIAGTLYLIDALAQYRPDFIALFSSTSGLRGIPGQIDYSAANAFLDAFARYGRRHAGLKIVSLDWPAWNDTGMAARLTGTLRPAHFHDCSSALKHELFRACEVSGAGVRVRAKLDRHHWILADHTLRAEGVAVLPGTAYVDAAVCAGEVSFGSAAIVVTDLMFLEPLVARPDIDEQVELVAMVNPPVDGVAECEISSTQNGKSTVHATCGLAPHSPTPAAIDLTAIERRCTTTSQIDGALPHEFIVFGSHWEVVDRLSTGQTEALAFLRLRGEGEDDFALNPPLLDMATGAGQLLDSLQGAGNLVPLAYKKIVRHSTLAREIVSHVRLIDANPETVTFDITISDPAGTVIVEISGFSLRVRPDGLRSAFAPARGAVGEHSNEAAQVQHFEHSITSAEGFRALKYATVGDLGHQVLIFPGNPEPFLQPELPEETGGGAGAIAERPDVSTQFESPAPGAETNIAAIWSDVLGVKQVGRSDNFFELGGHSLLLTRIVNRIRKELDLVISPEDAFRVPTVAAWSQAIQSQADGASATERVRQDRDEQPTVDGCPSFPMSFPQQQIWYIQQLDAENVAYNIPFGFTVGVPVDVVALKSALNTIVARHEALRTAFVLVDDEPRQVIRPPCEVPVQVIDLETGLTGKSRTVHDVTLDESRRPFDLTSGLLVRAAVLREEGSEDVVFLNFHHISLDHLSVLMLGEQLAGLYRARLGASEPEIDEPIAATQAPDFAVWQRQTLDSCDHLDFWRTELKGIPAFLDLPTDRQRPVEKSFNGLEHRFNFSASLSGQIDSFARARGATHFMIMLAGFAALLNRYTGERDVVVGCPFANRGHSDFQTTVGCLMNTLPVRIQVDPDEPFSFLLDRVREAVTRVFSHQQTPFELIVEDLDPPRDPARNPMFQVAFMLQDPPMDLDLGNARAVSSTLHNGTSKFEMYPWLWLRDGLLEGLIEYDTDLFEPKTVERFVSCYVALFASVCDSPDSPLREIDILPRSMRNDVLDRSGPEVDAPDSPLDMIAAAASENPDNVAVLYGERSIDYRTLDTLSRNVAAHLLERGVGAGSIVGVCLERILELPAVLLGIWRAGAAYLPIDPAFPEARIEYMVEDSGTELVIADSQSKPESIPDELCASLDTLLENGSSLSGGPPEPEQTAYVIYTSGSTGQPKGVVVPHRAVANFLASMAREPGIRAADRLLAVTTVSFDISVLEMFLPLTVGACVVIADREMALDGFTLAAELRRSGSTMMQATPATWRMLIDAEWSGGPDFRILCGGEAMPPDLTTELLGRCSELWNLYGPTETTVWSTVQRLNEAEGTIPIGTPIDNTSTYVLDDSGNLVPDGVWGELFIGGRGVTSGYLNRPELTKERFVADPFGGGLMYKTGDLARWNKNGLLVCGGRNDDQVKLRGHRIELGEIESALVKHSAVSEVAVAAAGGSILDRTLTAYVTLKQGRDMLVSEMRRFLRQTLPDYMVPSLLVELPELPRTPNNKLDRNALPDPLSNPGRSLEKRLPQNEIERALAGIWGDVLGIDTIGLDDNFFELGGHSLLSVRVVRAVERSTGVKIDQRSLFFQSLEQIARSINSEKETR